MSSAVVLRRGHVEVEKHVRFVDNDWRPILSDRHIERRARKRSPLVICVHHGSCNSCACVNSRGRQWIDSTHHSPYHGDEWRQSPYHQGHHAARYGNEVMVASAHPRQYASEPVRAQPAPMLPYHHAPNTGAVVYQPQVYQDPHGRLYTADAYGRSRWL